MILPPAYVPLSIAIGLSLTHLHSTGGISSVFGKTGWRGPSWMFLIVVRGLRLATLLCPTGSDGLMQACILLFLATFTMKDTHRQVFPATFELSFSAELCYA